MKRLFIFLAALVAWGCTSGEEAGFETDTEIAGRVQQTLNSCDPLYADSIPQTAGNPTIGDVATSAPWTAPGRINKLYAIGDGWDITYTPVSGLPVTQHISFGPTVTCTHDQVGGWNMPSPGDNLRQITMWADHFSMVFAINGSTQPMNVFRCYGMQADAAHRNTHVMNPDGVTKITRIMPGADPQSLVFSGVNASGVAWNETIKFYGSCHVGPNTAPNYTQANPDTTPAYTASRVRTDDATNEALFEVYGSQPFASVEFFVDGVSRGTDTTVSTSGPDNWWEMVVPGLAQGWHSLRAVATFPGGAQVWQEKQLFYSKRKVVAGNDFTCWIGPDNGTVACWGKNNYGQAGNGVAGANISRTGVNWVKPGAQVQSPYFSSTKLAYVTDVSAGLEGACAVADGGVLCWGKNTYGLLGVSSGTLSYSSLPVQVIPSGSGVTQVSVGGQHACAVFSAVPKVKCWGRGSYGQLGDGTFTSSSPTPVAMLNSSSAVKVHAARDTTFFLTSAGDVLTVGRDDYGQLGNDPYLTNQATPGRIFGAGSGGVASRMWGGWYHGCVELAAGGLKCWGSNGSGGLGDGTTVQRPMPVTATAWSGSTIVDMALGDDSSCAVTGSGQWSCLGGNSTGQHGVGTTVDSLTPVTPTGYTSGVLQMASGFDHVCAIKGPSVKCAGDNTYEQVGPSSIGNPRTTPY